MAKPSNEMVVDLPNALPDFANWTEEQVGFAPYWNPEENKWIFAQVVEKDDRDPEFVRYLMRAGMDIPCKRGAVENAEDVLVKKGEYFSISVYFSLQGLFDLYLETGHRPFVKIESLKEVKTKKPGQTCWTWKVTTSPADKKHMNELRSKLKAMGDGEFPAKELR